MSNFHIKTSFSKLYNSYLARVWFNVPQFFAFFCLEIKICPQFFNSDFISSKPSFAYFLSYFVQQSNLLIHSVLLECPLSNNSYSHRTLVVLWKKEKKTRERNWPIIILLLCTIMCAVGTFIIYQHHVFERKSLWAIQQLKKKTWQGGLCYTPKLKRNFKDFFFRLSMKTLK